MAICVKGYCTFTLDDGFERISIKLDNPAQGLLIESCLWREMSDFSEDCVLLVLADADYDELDYIREYETFKRLLGDNMIMHKGKTIYLSSVTVDVESARKIVELRNGDVQKIFKSHSRILSKINLNG